MSIDKSVLAEYAGMKVEIKELRQRIQKLDKEIKNLSVVSDTVTGTREDGTIGSIKITGYPTPKYYKKAEKKKELKALLDKKEAELLELTIQVEEYIETIPKSELRVMFRLYYLSNLTWNQVAHRMNDMYPKRRIKYTEDNCWRKNQRFFENVGSRREETC